MRRLHLVEFEDCNWFPASVRNGITDYLRFFISFINLYKPIVPHIRELLEKSGSDRIIELGAGGGGGIEGILEFFNNTYREKISITLTDYYPNIGAFNLIKKRTKGQIDFISYPVDAANVPENLKGARTLFSAFHHFEPSKAKEVLRDAVKKNSPIGIFDGAERKLRYIIGVVLSTLLLIFLVPLFTPPFKAGRFIFTYLIPLIPVFALFDGIVSMLRMYTPEELLIMAKEVEPEKYEWKSGKEKLFGYAYVVYLTGYPKKNMSFK